VCPGSEHACCICVEKQRTKSLQLLTNDLYSNDLYSNTYSVSCWCKSQHHSACKTRHTHANVPLQGSNSLNI
jgi:hypothetical protein